MRCFRQKIFRIHVSRKTPIMSVGTGADGTPEWRRRSIRQTRSCVIHKIRTVCVRKRVENHNSTTLFMWDRGVHRGTGLFLKIFKRPLLSLHFFLWRGRGDMCYNHTSPHNSETRTKLFNITRWFFGNRVTDGKLSLSYWLNSQSLTVIANT